MTHQLLCMLVHNPGEAQDRRRRKIKVSSSRLRVIVLAGRALIGPLCLHHTKQGEHTNCLRPEPCPTSLLTSTLQVLIPSVKLDYSHVQSRCGSLDRRGYSAGGGNVSLVLQAHRLSVVDPSVCCAVFSLCCVHLTALHLHCSLHQWFVSLLLLLLRRPHHTATTLCSSWLILLSFIL